MATPFRSQMVDDLVNLRFRAHVHAARGLVQDQQFGHGGQPFADDHLLLVAAAERRGKLLWPAANDAELFDHLLGDAALHGGFQPRPGKQPAQGGEGKVAFDAHGQHQPLELPVLRQVHQPLIDPLLRAAFFHQLAVVVHLPAKAVAHAENALGQLRAPRAHRARRCRPPRPCAPSGKSAPFPGAILSPSTRSTSSSVGVWPQVIHVAERAPDHHVHHAVMVKISHIDGAHIAAVPQHGEPVADLLEFLKAVGDIDDAHAPRLEVADDLEQMVDLGLRQACGGLVHDDNPAIARYGLDDFHHLLVGGGKVAHQCVGVDREAKPVEHFAAGAVHFPPVGKQLADLLAQEQILRHVQVEAQIQLLMDKPDAHRLRLAGVVKADLPVKKPDAALVVGNDAAQNLHQGGFARAVFPDQDMYLLLANVKMHIVEDFHIRVADGLAVGVVNVFGDMVHFKDGIAHAPHLTAFCF